MLLQHHKNEDKELTALKKLNEVLLETDRALDASSPIEILELFENTQLRIVSIYDQKRTDK